MSDVANFDLVILGSGSTAFAAALRAQELGKTSVMTEERTTGGTCVNRGCLPSKNLIEAAKLLHDARHPRYPGLQPAQMGLDFRQLIEQKDDVVRGYRNKKYESLVGGQFQIEMGHARFVDEHTVELDSKKFTGEKILIATGSRPVIPAIEGLDRVPYLTSAMVTSVRSKDGHVIATTRIGSEARELEAEKLLVATGRRPNTDSIALERAGVETGEKGQILVDQYLRTNVPHIFAAGDIIGRETASQMATPVGSQDGGIAAYNALSGETPRAVNHRVIPRAIFTDPQIGIVGITEAEAVAAGRRCWCNALPMSLVPRAGAIRDTRGMIKMVADADTEEVLGVSMVGPSAGEVIHEAAMALRFRVRLRDFIDLLHVYPTMAEALKIIAISRYKDPSKLSCCAE